MTLTSITQASLNKFENDLTATQLCQNVFSATAFANTQRDNIDRLSKEVLQEIPLFVSNEWAESTEERITDPSKAWLADKPAWTTFYNRLVLKQSDAQIFPAKEGNCPALEAEQLLTEAEGVLIKYACEFLNIDNAELSIFKFRKQFLDILLRMHAKKTETVAVLQ